MAIWHDKLTKYQEWVPEGGLPWQTLENAKTWGWDDRDAIKDAIKYGKMFKPKKEKVEEEEEEPPPRVQVLEEDEVVLPDPFVAVVGTPLCRRKFGLR